MRMDAAEVVWNFEDAGTTTISSEGKANSAGPYIQNTKRHGSYSVLFFKSGNCAFIPKRILAEDRIVELRQILQGHIGKGEEHDSV